MPATRIPPGFKASDPGDDSGLDPASADTDKGDVQGGRSQSSGVSQELSALHIHVP